MSRFPRDPCIHMVYTPAFSRIEILLTEAANYQVITWLVRSSENSPVNMDQCAREPVRPHMPMCHAPQPSQATKASWPEPGHTRIP